MLWGTSSALILLVILENRTMIYNNNIQYLALFKNKLIKSNFVLFFILCFVLFFKLLLLLYFVRVADPLSTLGNLAIGCTLCIAIVRGDFEGSISIF